MLSKLSSTFNSEFLRENLQEVNSTDLVIKTISHVPEMSAVCGLVGMFLSFFELHSMEISGEKRQLPVPSFLN